METVKDTLSELTEHIHRLSVGDFQADVAGPQTDGPKRVEVEPAGDGLFRLTCFPEPFPHVSPYVSSLLGGLSVQEVAQLFDVFRGKPLTRAGVERALECYIIVKRAKEHGKLLARKFLKPSEKRGLGYGEMHEVNAGPGIPRRRSVSSASPRRMRSTTLSRWRACWWMANFGSFASRQTAPTTGRLRV